MFDAAVHWRFGLMTWERDTSQVGWVTRTILLSAVVLLAFACWALPSVFATQHPYFTVCWLIQWIAITVHRIVVLYCRFDAHYDYPRCYSLHNLALNDGGAWEWIAHRIMPIPFWTNRRNSWATRAYYLYALLFVEWFLAFGVFQVVDKMVEPTTSPPSPTTQWLSTNAGWIVLGMMGCVFSLFVYAGIRGVVRQRYIRLYLNPLTDANQRHERERQVLQTEIAELTEKNRVLAEKLAADGAVTHYVGEMIALTTQLLKGVPAKRGDGNIGEARKILEYLLETHLIIDRTERLAALYEALEELGWPDRKRWSPPVCGGVAAPGSPSAI